MVKTVYSFHRQREETIKPSRPLAGRELLAESLYDTAKKPQISLSALITNLSSTEALKRTTAVTLLKKYVNDVDKARDVLSMLPPDDAAKISISEIRMHCTGIIRKSLRG